MTNPLSRDPRARTVESNVQNPCPPEKHRWSKVRDTSHTIYSRCTACGKRRAAQPIRAQRGFSQKIDERWVQTGEWSPDTPMIAHRPGAPKQSR